MHAALATLVAEAPPLRLKDVTGIMALNGEEVWAFVCVFVCVWTEERVFLWGVEFWFFLSCGFRSAGFMFRLFVCFVLLDHLSHTRKIDANNLITPTTHLHCV